MNDNPNGGTQIKGDANVKDGDFVAGDKVTNINLDVEKLVEVLRQALPEDDPMPQHLLKALSKFRHFHSQLFEWKEVHNFMNDILMFFGSFSLEIERLQNFEEQPNRRFLGPLWKPTSQKVNELEAWSKEIKYIDSPFVRTEQGMKGPSWVIEMVSLKESIDQLLAASPIDANALYKAREEFGDKAEINMYQADKKLRETTGELYNLSSIVLGSFNHE